MVKPKHKKNRVYLDHAASTPLDKKVSIAMQKAEKLAWGNPSSLHQEGEMAREILIQAREEVADILNCRAGEVYFTSGGTEAINLAIQGIIKHAKTRSIIPHIITSSIEHPAVLETIKNLSDVEVSIISPDSQGIINPQSIEKELRPNTVLVCLMHANNEVGTLQPVHKVGSILREFRKNKKDFHGEPLQIYPYLLVDASQSTLYENVGMDRLNADILILDGIKMYGPRGAGILAIRHGVGISPTIFGGGQEKGLRPGTENVVSAVGLAEALKIANKTRTRESLRLSKLRDYAINKIISGIPGSSLNGHPSLRLPNNINICLPQGGSLVELDSEFLVIKLDTVGFSVSSASACSNLKTDSSGGSYVIRSLGKPECASSSLRFTLGRSTKKSDLDKLISALKSILL